MGHRGKKTYVCDWCSNEGDRYILTTPRERRRFCSLSCLLAWLRHEIAIPMR